MPINVEEKTGGVHVEEKPSNVKKLGANCDLSNEYVDVSQTPTCASNLGGRDHQLPGYTRTATCRSCNTTFDISRYRTTGGFSTIACPSCGTSVGYMGYDGTCSWYTCSGTSSCSSGKQCPTKRVIDSCDLEIINDLICQLRAELKDGNQSCYAFSAAELSAFLDGALSDFNGTPKFTAFTWKTIDLTLFRRIICEGAFLLAIGAQIFIEAGREFTINDNGISFTPAQLSSALAGQFSARYSQYKTELNFIKDNMRSAPAGVLNYSSLLTGSGDGGAVNPNFLRLRHLRGRRIY